jgi:hypothetical protein
MRAFNVGFENQNRTFRLYSNHLFNREAEEKLQEHMSQIVVCANFSELTVYGVDSSGGAPSATVCFQDHDLLQAQLQDHNLLQALADCTKFVKLYRQLMTLKWTRLFMVSGQQTQKN